MPRLYYINKITMLIPKEKSHSYILSRGAKATEKSH